MAYLFNALYVSSWLWLVTRCPFRNSLIAATRSLRVNAGILQQLGDGVVALQDTDEQVFHTGVLVTEFLQRGKALVNVVLALRDREIWPPCTFG